METKIVHGYELREPTVGDVPGMFSMFAGDNETPTSTIVRDMMRNCVYKDNQKLGDKISEIPLSKVKDIINELMEMSGILGNQEKK